MLMILFLDTCFEYANSHNLKFRTDPNPGKSITKCIAFCRKQDENLTNLKLGENSLPWVTNAKHFGNTLQNIMDGLKKDTLIKRARYIGKNQELQQEFHFAHPDSQFKINRIYNSHFTGSSLWDLFSRETVMVENSWNVSFRLMYGLPRNTHRYFVEPISGTKHIKCALIKNFLNFIEQIKKSNKSVSKALLHTIKHDVNSVTGSNLRNIMKLVNKNSISDLSPDDSRLVLYHPVPAEEEWRISLVRELIDIRSQSADLQGFSWKELEDILHFACTI